MDSRRVGDVASFARDINTYTEPPWMGLRRVGEVAAFGRLTCNKDPPTVAVGVKYAA